MAKKKGAAAPEPEQEPADERLSPMRAAERVGKHPSQVYGWIKKGRLKKGDDGLVSLAEAMAVAAESTERGNAKHDPEVKRKLQEQKRIKEGQMAVWLSGKGKTSAGLVTDAGSGLVELTRDDGRSFPATVDGLDEQIRQGRFKFAKPSEVLSLVADQYDFLGRPDIGKSLRKWMSSFSDIVGGLDGCAPERKGV